MDSLNVHDNPLVGRYASREMAELWGPQRKFSTWRRLWVALAAGLAVALVVHLALWWHTVPAWARF